MRVSQHPFEVPASSDFPALFSGYVCIGFAGGRWWSGADTDSSMDAYHKMVDAARLALMPAAAVEKSLDPTFFPNTVQVFQVDGSAG